MVTLLSSLQSINAYPVPQSFFETAAASRGIDLEAEISQEALNSKEYRLTTADVLMYLSVAPNVSQGGQSYSFDEKQRQNFRNKAYNIYDELSEEGGNTLKPTYGYKGSRL
jgi:hypothetical protein